MSLLVDEKTLIAADSDAVMNTLLDHPRLARFFNAQFTEVIGANQGEPCGGVGTIRQVETFGQRFDEQVIIAEPLRLHYRIVGEGPLRRHLGTIELSPQGQGTQLHYRIEGKSASWIPTFVVAWALRRDIRRALTKLRAHYAA